MLSVVTCNYVLTEPTPPQILISGRRVIGVVGLGPTDSSLNSGLRVKRGQYRGTFTSRR